MIDSKQAAEMAKTRLQGSSPTQTTHSKTSDIDERSKQAAVYFFNRLQQIYLSKFSQAFKTGESIKLARREWVHEIGALSREQIDIGMDKVKQLCSVKDGDFEWPNIALTIGLCNGNYKLAKTAEQQRLKTIEEDEIRKIAREFRLADTKAQDAAKRARDKFMDNIRATLSS